MYRDFTYIDNCETIKRLIKNPAIPNKNFDLRICPLQVLLHQIFNIGTKTC